MKKFLGFSDKKMIIKIKRSKTPKKLEEKNHLSAPFQVRILFQEIVNKLG